MRPTFLQRFANAIARHEVWLVGSAVLLGTLSERLLLAALLICVFAALCRWISLGQFSQRTVADSAILLLLLTLPISLWASPYPHQTLTEIYRLLVGICSYYMLVNWLTSTRRIMLLRDGLVVLAVALACVTPLFMNGQDAWLVLFGRILPLIPTTINGTLNPNIVAGAIVFILPMPIATLLFDWSQQSVRRRLLSAAAIGIMTPLLIVALSRGALVALLFSGFCLLILRNKELLPPLTIITLVAAAIFNSLRQTAAQSNSLSTIETRVEIWSRSVYMIQDFPLSGVGMGNFGRVADTLYPFFLSPPGTIPHTHNIFLQLAVDLGVVGLIAWLALLLIAIVTCTRMVFAATPMDTSQQAVVAGLLVAQGVLVVHGLIDAPLWGTRVAVFVWIIWGMIAAIHNLQIAHLGGDPRV